MLSVERASPQTTSGNIRSKSVSPPKYATPSTCLPFFHHAMICFPGHCFPNHLVNAEFDLFYLNTSRICFLTLFSSLFSLLFILSHRKTQLTLQNNTDTNTKPTEKQSTLLRLFIGKSTNQSSQPKCASPRFPCSSLAPRRPPSLVATPPLAVPAITARASEVAGAAVAVTVDAAAEAAVEREAVLVAVALAADAPASN
ncbi:uncharacterized protein F4822DRAFT_42972 [Hypoxylon trugodes]|uniref:uncharacterized protein n=1 Tax=Hypoxylon trugodes TaxID=326681 RepID=UPI00219E2D90|nr:uncharacterized protein F4822DRAFT_42972 [Hypoxylon trugodes]KAI1394258.1 hypothetical protein F4822DRAFT_42972 [Hypoxylon trugodes]